MDTELQAIADAMDKQTGKGRNDTKARELADRYVADHPEHFTELATKTLVECVNAVEVFRNAGMTNEQWRVETWLLHHYQPQQIGGTAEPTVRIA